MHWSADDLTIPKPLWLNSAKWKALSNSDQRYCHQTFKNNTLGAFSQLVLIVLFGLNGVTLGIQLSSVILIVVMVGFYIIYFHTNYYFIAPIIVPFSVSVCVGYLYIYYANNLFLLVIIVPAISALADFKNIKIGYALFVFYVLEVLTLVLLHDFLPKNVSLGSTHENIIVVSTTVCTGVFCNFLILNYRNLEEKFGEILSAKNLAINKQYEKVMRLQKESYEHEVNRTLRQIDDLRMVDDHKVQLQDQLLQELKVALDSDDTVKKVRNILNTLQAHKAEDERKQVLRSSDLDATATSGFIERLMETHPDLSKTEREIAAFLRLKLSTKEISHLRKTSESAIFAAKSRLRKKLDLDEKMNLEQYLQTV